MWRVAIMALSVCSNSPVQRRHGLDATSAPLLSLEARPVHAARGSNAQARAETGRIERAEPRREGHLSHHRERVRNQDAENVCRAAGHPAVPRFPRWMEACTARAHGTRESETRDPRAPDQGETAMPGTAVATLQTIWDCRWSRPGFRLFGASEQDQPETPWVCVRTGQRRAISEEECERCPYWEAVPPRRDAN